MLKNLLLTLYLTLLFECPMLASSLNKELLESINSTLEQELTRQDAPSSYHESFATWRDSYQDLEEKAESEDILEFAKSINTSLKSMKQSHLNFYHLEGEDESSRKIIGFYSEIRKTQEGNDARIVVQVDPFSPAETAGIQVGDEIIKVQNDSVASAIIQFISTKEKDSKLALQKVQVTLISEDELDSPHWREIEYGGTKAIYLAIPSFSESYDRSTVNNAFKAANEVASKFIIVDLRGNTGGNSYHFLSNLLPPETHIETNVGEQSDKTKEENRSENKRQRLYEENCLAEAKEVYLHNYSHRSEFHGSIAIIVGSHSQDGYLTSCAAEIAAIVPREIFEKKFHAQLGIQIGENSDMSTLFPDQIEFFGETGGRTQSCGSNTYYALENKLILNYPLYEIYTPVFNRHMEGRCFKGVKVGKKTNMIDEAFKWFHRISQSNILFKRPHYIDAKTYAELLRKAAKVETQDWNLDERKALMRFVDFFIPEKNQKPKPFAEKDYEKLNKQLRQVVESFSPKLTQFYDLKDIFDPKQMRKPSRDGSSNETFTSLELMQKDLETALSEFLKRRIWSH